ncbi:MAG: tRNA (cytidine32/uridine32-2'-O)-methyltransferase [Planctomycetota bacterium]|jgi:tRNA (cytidine32/uridine32-2'-O)-methyltransferase
MHEHISKNIKVVLVGTTHPGNIGATARAMKTMGLEQLVLVNPKIYPDADATARASGADDILAEAIIHQSFSDAISDCHFVFGTSTRNRSIPWPLYTPSEAAQQTRKLIAEDSVVAIVFGRESSGLANEELELCNAMIQIPSNPEFSSLNIAAAVQIISYEIRKNMLETEPVLVDIHSKTPLASVEQIQQLYDHLQQCLVDIGYFDPDKPRRLMRRLKRIINRSQLDANEYNIARGVLTAIQKAAEKEKD